MVLNAEIALHLLGILQMLKCDFICVNEGIIVLFSCIAKCGVFKFAFGELLMFFELTNISHNYFQIKSCRVVSQC